MIYVVKTLAKCYTKQFEILQVIFEVQLYFLILAVLICYQTV